MSSDFPCTGCGACCRSILLSAQTKWLDRGDGVCRYFDENKSICTVYENRPDVCNVRTMYDRYYKFRFNWPDFVAINQEACVKIISIFSKQ